MSAWFLSVIAIANLVGGMPDVLAPINASGGEIAPAADAAALRVADGTVLHRGDSTRPRVEIPSNALPPGVEAPPSAVEGGSSASEGADRALGTRGLGPHRPGELYVPPGDHRPGDLDNQGIFRPGDMG